MLQLLLAESICATTSIVASPEKLGIGSARNCSLLRSACQRIVCDVVSTKISFARFRTSPGR